MHDFQTGETLGALSIPLTPGSVAEESPVRTGPESSRARAVRLVVGWLVAGVLAGALVGFLWWVSVVPLRSQPPLLQLTIPGGTNAAIDRGEEPPGLPRRIELGPSQRLYVVNLDSAEHLIAGTLIRPATSVVIEPTVLSAEEVACTVHPSGSIGVVIKDGPEASHSTLVGSMAGVPFGLLGAFAAMLSVRLRVRNGSEEEDMAPVLPPSVRGAGHTARTLARARFAVGVLGAACGAGRVHCQITSRPRGPTAIAALWRSRNGQLACRHRHRGSAVLVKDDEWAPLPNGDTITVGELDIAVSISPYPPGRQANLDLGIMRNGVPVTGANVTLEYDMKVMEHGALRLLALPGGAGHYLMPLDFIMAGDFQLKVIVDTGDSKETVSLGVRATR